MKFFANTIILYCFRFKIILLYKVYYLAGHIEYRYRNLDDNISSDYSVHEVHTSHLVFYNYLAQCALQFYVKLHIKITLHIW